jgi:stage III sporulation protein AB
MGFYYSYLVKERFLNSERIRKALICLRGEIQFGRTPMPEALSSVARHTTGNISEFFYEVSRELRSGRGSSFAVIWQEKTERYLEGKCIQKEDVTELKELGQTLGYLDSVMQVNTLNLYLERMQETLIRQNKEKQDKVRLYNLLGIIGGIMITIIII